MSSLGRIVLLGLMVSLSCPQCFYLKIVVVTCKDFSLPTSFSPPFLGKDKPISNIVKVNQTDVVLAWI